MTYAEKQRRAADDGPHAVMDGWDAGLTGKPVDDVQGRLAAFSTRELLDELRRRFSADPWIRELTEAGFSIHSHHVASAVERLDAERSRPLTEAEQIEDALQRR